MDIISSIVISILITEMMMKSSATDDFFSNPTSKEIEMMLSYRLILVIAMYCQASSPAVQ